MALPSRGVVGMMDVAQGFFSWWGNDNTSPDMNLAGVLIHDDGSTVLVTDDGAYRVTGNIDGEASLTTSNDIDGLFLGDVLPLPEQNPVVRRVDVSTDGPTVICCLRAQKQSKAATQHPAVEGVNEWGEADRVDPPNKSKRFTRSKRTDDIALAVGVTGQRSRIKTEIYLEVRGSGKRRRPT